MEDTKKLARGLLSALIALFLIPIAAHTQVEKYDQISYPPLPGVEIPQPQRFELDNGMVVILIEDHELPLIEARALIRTGSRWEPPEQIGLASLTGQVLRSGGTATLPSDGLDDLLEDKAAIIETSIGTASGSAFMSCLEKDFAEVLSIFAEVLRRPAFEEDKLIVAKTQQSTLIARQNDNVSQIVGREFTELIYGSDSPYARSETYNTLDNISRDDLVAWHAAWFQPQRVILGLVGDFETREALAHVRAAFGDWQPGENVAEPEVAYLEKPVPGIYYIEKNDVSQSYIRMGHSGLLRSHPDYYAVEVMNQVLGGGFASRLFASVRTQKGLAYNVSGRVTSGWDYPGFFFMSMSTKTETTAAGIDALIEEARRLQTEPPSDREIDKAKASILNSFVFNSDSTSKLLAQQLSYEYYDYPRDWLERYRRGIEAVTAAEVREAAAKHVRPDQLAILVVGPSSGTDRPLSDYGEVRKIDITIPEFAGPEVEFTAAGKERAAALIARAVEAIGGAERLDAVSSVATTFTARLVTPQGEVPMSGSKTIAYPDRMRLQWSLPSGTFAQVLNGEQSFVETPQGTMPIPADRRQTFERDFRRDVVTLLRLRDTEEFMAVTDGAGKIDGQTVEYVYIELSGDELTLGIEPQSGRISSLSFLGTNLAGAPGDMQHSFSDYRQIDGLELPFAYTAEFNGEPMNYVELTSIELDQAIDSSLFETQP